MTVAALEAEMLEWATGRRSHLNEFMSVEGDPADRAQTLILVAQADAAEVTRLSAAIQALRSRTMPDLTTPAAEQAHQLAAAQDPDAMKWAEVFCTMVRAKPEIATDVGTMVGWFANAIGTGRANADAETVDRLRRVRGVADRVRERLYSDRPNVLGQDLQDALDGKDFHAT